ncbi:hypothetical protein K7432_000683 [Basidiobolus ranarum]|uniref:Uncharacterized protein n=1 Tax=Basidiobolus ranarum TaxID=34480 RepID=A0ABR2WAV6_9FUNG
MSDDKSAEKKHEEYLEEIKASRAKEELPPPSYEVPDACGMTEAARKKHQEHLEELAANRGNVESPLPSYYDEPGPSHSQNSSQPEEDLPPPDYAPPETNQKTG